jgi:putative ABC transport system permease protein
MLSNYLMSALRSLKRQKLFAIINIIGLAIGLAACTLIILFVQHEFSYDDFLTDVDRLYRVEATANIPGQQSTAVPGFFGPAFDLLPPEYEEIESIARLQQRGGTVVSGDSSTPETFMNVDPAFTSMFDFPVVEGTLEGALEEPTSIVLTEEKAVQYLGDRPWVGQTLDVNETYERELKVTAVIETLPGNTHFDIDFLIPITERTYETQRIAGGVTDLQRWNGLPFNVYIRLKEGRSIEPMRSSINEWVDKHFPSQIQRLVGISGSELFTPRIMNVRDIHMESPVVFDMRAPGDISTIYGFAGIAVLIMVIAGINFMNLATAASTLRAKEVAVRKVMGASRGQLFTQFETEALCASFFALLLALFAIELILPAFSNYTERELTTALLLDPVVAGSIALLTILVGVLAGMHPALVLSGFRPARVLQANRSGVSGNPMLRTTLVLFQFAISAALIISTLLIYIQTDYARSMQRGYDNEYVLTVRGLGQDQVISSVDTIMREVAEMPGVTDVSLADFTPGDGQNVGLSLKAPGIDERLIIFYRSVYPEFFSQFDVKPIAGRLLNRDVPNDTTEFTSRDDLTPVEVNVVVNEAAVQKLGFGSPQEAIGKFYYRGQENQIVSTIVGVIPNVHFGSPRQEIDGEIYMIVPSQINNLLITYEPGEYQEVSSAIEAKIRGMFPRVQTVVQHLQENIAQQFREEEVQSTLLALFAGLAILVACMGLFGLASFTIGRRTKEIGVRKVMGATSSEIVLLFLRQFSWPVLIANIIAWPFCWYAVNQWLEGFNHQIDLLPWFAGVVVVAIFVTIALAWATVASHAWRVARTSPIFALRYE